MSRRFGPADERRQVPGAGPDWSEAWMLDWVTVDGSTGGFVRLGLHSSGRPAWYWASLAGTGRHPVIVVDYDVPPPRGPGLEIRTEGLWADHVVEVPFDHMTLGCEAFGLRLDDPVDIYGHRELRGERTPFGLDLEWETDGSVEAGLAVCTATAASRDGYTIPCRVHGEVLVGDERLVVDLATGRRVHTWGPGPAWVKPWAHTRVGGAWAATTSL